MKNKDIIKYSLLNTLRKEKNKLIIFVTILCAIIIFIICLIYQTFNEYLNINYYKNVDFRTIYIMKNDKEPIDENKLKNIKHIIDVKSALYNNFSTYSNLDNQNVNGIISLTPYNETVYKTITGKTLPNIEKGTAICPINFYPDSKASDVANIIDTKGIIRNSQIKGQKIVITYDIDSYDANNNLILTHQQKEFKVVETYNHNLILYPANKCLISYEDMDELLESIYSKSQIANSSKYVYVDELKNVNSVLSEIQRMGYLAQVNGEFNEDLINKIKLVFVIIVIIPILVLIITLYLNNKKRIMSESKNIGIFKSFGFNKMDIEKYYYLQEFIINIFTYILSLIITFIIYIIINNIFKYYSIIYALKINYNFSSLILTFVSVFLMPYLLSIFYINKINNEDVINLLKGEE